MLITQPYNNDIVLIKDFIVADDLKLINDFIAGLTDKDWDDGNQNLSDEELNNFQNKTIRIIPYKHKEISTLLDRYLDQANIILSNYYKGFRLNYGHHTITRTTSNGMDKHSDNNGSNGVICGCVFYFNEDFVGGELVYDNLNITYKPAAGDFIFHPGTPIYEHHVNDVSSGIRLVYSFSAYEL